VIYVRDGVYCERIVVNKTLSLIGASKYGTIIDANNIGKVVEVTSNNVTITNFSIRNSGYQKAGIYLADVQGCSIQDNHLTNNYIGIWLQSSFNNNISRNTVTNNHQEGYYPEGIRLELSHHNILSENNVTNNFFGVNVRGSSNNSIYGNRVANHDDFGFWVYASSNNEVYENSVTQNEVGFWIRQSSDNTFYRNILEENYVFGVRLERASNNILSQNTLVSNFEAIQLLFSHANNIYGNNITNSSYGFFVEESFNNTIYHNNLINNRAQFYVEGKSYHNMFDYGYPSGGNYWSDCIGVDLYRGPCQNETGSDGIGDTPYVVNEDNIDEYPLMKPYPWALHDLGITNVTSYKTVMEQGFALRVNVTVFNYGNYTENFNVRAFTEPAQIQTENITLTSRNFTTATFTWNTTGWTKGNYTITVCIQPIPEEPDVTDNTYNLSVCITIPGDVDGDRDVDILDVVKITSIYAIRLGDPRFRPNSDIDNDGVITILDVVKCTSHYAQKDP